MRQSRALLGSPWALSLPSEKRNVDNFLNAFSRHLRAIENFCNSDALPVSDEVLLFQLALQAYFSSEIGMTRALRYVMTPGKWVGCVPLQPNQPAWA